MKSLLRIALLSIWCLAISVMTPAQTTVNSNSVNVDNAAPNVVWFTFPLETGSNVIEIKFGCDNSPFRETFIYEQDPVTKHITAYPFLGGLACTPQADGYTLTNDVTLHTADHTVTIKQSTNWTASLEFCGRGRCWKATGGSSQIVVQ